MKIAQNVATTSVPTAEPMIVAGVSDALLGDPIIATLKTIASHRCTIAPADQASEV
ncbi:MAG: hypothetical protein ACKVS9_00555 [Phycisphaerae bacterium]